MRDRLFIFLLLSSIAAATRHIPARRTCRDHYLAGHDESGVYEIKHHDSPTYKVLCRMPPLGSPQAVVSTVLRSALERGYRVQAARTVQWQVNDYAMLQELVNKSINCKQTIYFNRTARRPAEQLEHGETTPTLPPPCIMLYPILGDPQPISGDLESGKLELYGQAAGVLHVVPDDHEYEYNPTIRASELVCDDFVRRHDECLIDGGVEVNTAGSGRAHFRFAFRTEETNQPLFTAHHEKNGRTVVELKDDFFLTAGDDTTTKLLVGHISDGRWHTAQIALDGSHMSIDGGQKIHLNPLGDVQQVSIRIKGYVMLTDPVDERESCLNSQRISKDFQPSHHAPFCAQSELCECAMLQEYFVDPLPSTVCLHADPPAEGTAFTLSRHPDLLSFLMLPEALPALEQERIALAMTFKSDADSGLLLFGEWRSEREARGRVQVHYHGQNLTAVHCAQADDNSIEICRSCLITRAAGFGTDLWTRVTVFEAEEKQLYLTVDSEICAIHEVTDETAEMYKTAIAKSSVLFVGGMFNKKVKSGIYKEEFKAKFFENTREKLPSLRGCVKDVFARGKRVDIAHTFIKQWQSTLIRPDPERFALVLDCPSCPSACPLNTRCRPTSPLLHAPHKCDCADAELYERNGVCVKQSKAPLSLERNSPSAYRGEFAVAGTGVLSKIWIKIKLPSSPPAEDTPILSFFSHGKTVIFRLYLTANFELAVQVTPENPMVYTAEAASDKLDPMDDRIHLVTIEKRTPLGTHPSRRFFDLYIDGRRYSIRDPAMTLTTIEFNLQDVEEGTGGCVSDLGLAFDYDEHRPVDDVNNRISTLNVLEQMTYEMGISQGGESATCGVLDPLLWVRGGVQPAPLGVLIEHTPATTANYQFSGASWWLVSIILTTLLALLLLCCIVLYMCCMRKRTRKDSFDDQERMLRDSPDYGHPTAGGVTYRRNTFGDDTSLVSDSIDRTDFSAYCDPMLHKVKVDRESMISWGEPTVEQRIQEAQIVVRNKSPDCAPIAGDDQSDL